MIATGASNIAMHYVENEYSQFRIGNDGAKISDIYLLAWRIK